MGGTCARPFPLPLALLKYLLFIIHYLLSKVQVALRKNKSQHRRGSLEAPISTFFTCTTSI